MNPAFEAIEKENMKLLLCTMHEPGALVECECVLAVVADFFGLVCL